MTPERRTEMTVGFSPETGEGNRGRYELERRRLVDLVKPVDEVLLLLRTEHRLVRSVGHPLVRAVGSGVHDEEGGVSMTARGVTDVTDVRKRL